jgi:uroporphyrin-III C-methyltransferase
MDAGDLEASEFEVGEIEVELIGTDAVRDEHVGPDAGLEADTGMATATERDAGRAVEVEEIAGMPTGGPDGEDRAVPSTSIPLVPPGPLVAPGPAGPGSQAVLPGPAVPPGPATSADPADAGPRETPPALVTLADRDAAAIAAALPDVRASAAGGWVALVGGGPGPVDLITVRGLALLHRADVVVVDRLAPRDLLAELRPEVRIVDAGKGPHGHNLSQDEINDLIVELARAGHAVVRLKGGDPFLFGRGGEEALTCRAAGIPCEVVPGVTSAVAVPALVGIPVTHRGLTQDVSVVSGHVDPSHPGSTVDWDALATGPGTIVVLMGVGALGEISSELVKRGRRATTPVAVIHAGGTPQQRLVTGTLTDIAAIAAAAEIGSPAVIVIGEVVSLRDEIGTDRV